jgi:hypothetical protein
LVDFFSAVFSGTFSAGLTTFFSAAFSGGFSAGLATFFSAGLSPALGTATAATLAAGAATFGGASPPAAPFCCSPSGTLLHRRLRRRRCRLGSEFLGLERHLVLSGNANLDILHLLFGLLVHHHRQNYGGQSGKRDCADEAATSPFFQLQLRI